mgnify:CR=1 FL=1
MIKTLDKILEVIAKFYGKFWDTLIKIVYGH